MNRFLYSLALVVFGITLTVSGCGGGGGESPIPSGQLSRADLKLSAQGTTTSTLGTIDVSFPIPADYNVQSVVLSGNTLNKQGSIIDWSITPPSGSSTTSTLVIKLVIPTGFNLGEFATVFLSLINGRASAADFGNNVTFVARDLTAVVIPATAISPVFDLVNIR